MTDQPAYISFSQRITKQSRQALIAAVTESMSAGADEIHLMLSSGGGAIIPGFEIYNTLRALPVKLVTHNMASVNSIGSVVFLAADERYACPGSTFMFHGVNWDVPEDMINAARAKELLSFIEADERRISETIAAHTKLSVSDVEGFFEKADTLDAQRALDAGIVVAVREANIPSGSEVRVIPQQGAPPSGR